ncbi:MAG: PAS domain-containing protein [Alphaproteobacteria bacterium]|nr:PAS domain-containing protein [Alphaproteobacteria bacterium]
MVNGGSSGGLTPSALAFVDHWRALRNGKPVPTSQDFLDQVDPEFQPFVSFNDVEQSGRNVVALFGTGLVDLWKVDLTGKQVNEFVDNERADRLTVDMLRCAEKPCGIWEVSTFRTTSGRVIGWEMISLPLVLDDPDRIRIARYHNVLEPTEKDELIQDILNFQQKEWVDLGFGEPDAKPLMKTP